MPQVQSKIEKKCNVCVKEHLSNLSSNLNRARNEGRLCDFVIKVGSREFHVHKIILSEGSDYFKGMFSHKMKEMQSGVAEMKDIDPDCMDICIKYIYTGKVSVRESKILPLFKAAHLFQLTGLHDALVSFVDENLDAESYFMTKDLANQFGLSHLEEKCDRFVKENFEEISKLDEFKSVDKKTLFSLISDDENKASEWVKLSSVFQWIQFEPRTRKKILPTLHKIINFAKIPVEYRRKLIEDEPLVYSCSELLRHISLSVMDSANIKSKDLPSTSSSDAAETSDNSGRVIYQHGAPLWPKGQDTVDVDKDLFRFMQVAYDQKLTELLLSNGANIEVIVTGDEARLKFIPATSPLSFNLKTAKAEFMSLYDEIYWSAAQDIFSLKELTSSESISAAMATVKAVFEKVHVSRLISDPSEILFIAHTEEEVKAAMDLFEDALQ